MVLETLGLVTIVVMGSLALFQQTYLCFSPIEENPDIDVITIKLVEKNGVTTPLLSIK